MDYQQAVWKPADPLNFGFPERGDHGRQGQTIAGVVLHGTAGPGAVSWFQDPAAGVSAHYVVDIDGSVTQCVLEDDAAYHCGEVTPNSAYFERSRQTNLNLLYIGIEHIRDKANASPITPAQLAASIALIRDICQRRGPLPLILHDAIDVGRVCPGPAFPLAAIKAAVQEIPFEAEALSYYTQRGFTVDTTHAVWTNLLWPLYVFWKALDTGVVDVAAVLERLSPGLSYLAPRFTGMADLVKPGPLISTEGTASWGHTQPAAQVRLSNREVGVHRDPAGWLPYQVELF